MQQRRGTASQWTTANTILASGEIGFETDTNMFKIGDGITAWNDAPYFKNFDDLDASGYIKDNKIGAANGVAGLDSTGSVPVSQLQNLIDNAPDTLNTLNEIAGALDALEDQIVVVVDATMEIEIENRNNAIDAAIAQEVTDRTEYVDAAIADEVTDRDNAIATAKGQAETTAQGYVDTHAAVTTNVHGISDTSALATKAGIETLTNKTISAADNTVTINLADVIDVTASVSEVNVLDGITATTTELNYVDGVTSGIQDQLDDKAPLAAPALTGNASAENLTITGNLVVQGTTTTVEATNLEITDSLIYLAAEQYDTDTLDIGIFGAYGDSNSGHFHAGIVRDATDGKWKLISGAGEPTDSHVDFGTATYDTLKLGAVEFSDGSQTKQGVPSITPISQKNDDYTVALGDRDSLIEVFSNYPETITIPTNASVAFPIGTSIDILQTGAGQITIAGAGGVTVNATPGLKLRTQWSSATLFKRGTDTWVVFGDLTV